MKKKLISAMFLALLLSLMFVGTAFAHPDAVGENAPNNPNVVLFDTPAIAEDKAAVGLVDLNTDKVPVCGAHKAAH